jgi:hypothetical protein
MAAGAASMGYFCTAGCDGCGAVQPPKKAAPRARQATVQIERAVVCIDGLRPGVEPTPLSCTRPARPQRNRGKRSGDGGRLLNVRKRVVGSAHPCFSGPRLRRMAKGRVR